MYTIQSCTLSRHFTKSHICRVHTCLAVLQTCHLHFWKNGRDLLRVTTVPQGGTYTEVKSAQKVDHGEEHPPAALAGIRTRNPLITSPAL